MSPPPPAALALPDSHVTTKTLALFAAGLLSAFAAYSVLSHVRDTQTKTKSCRDPFSGNPKLLEDIISLRSLAHLTRSDNVNLQGSAIKIILDRAVSDKYLPDIIKACQPHQRSETRLKGVTTLQLLSRNENNKKILVDAGALEVLVNLLRATDIRETAQKYAAVAICDLVQSVDERKVRIVQAGVLDPLKRVLTSDVVHNNELKYWSLMVVHQISLCDSLHHSLITDGFVPLLARMSRLTFGNTNMPKYCMQSLVRIVATTDTAEAKDLLTELLNHNIVSLISVCLRSDDVELIYWASGLMHEYVLKDVSPRLFRQIKGVQTILLTLLGADETYISRVVLRTVKFMAHGQDTFQLEMIRIGLVKKIMHCVTADDDDVQYWATLCLLEVASQPESHIDILDAPELPTLLDIATSKKVLVAPFVTDILAIICGLNSNHEAITKHAAVIIDALNKLLAWEEPEVHPDIPYHAASSLFNLMSMTAPPLVIDDLAHKIITACLENFIAVVLDSERDRVQLTCAKTLLMFVIRDSTLITRLTMDVIDRFMTRITDLGGRLISAFFSTLVTGPLLPPPVVSVSSVPRSSPATTSPTSLSANPTTLPPRSSSLPQSQLSPSVRQRPQPNPSPLRNELVDDETSPPPSPYPFHNPEIANSLGTSGMDFARRHMFPPDRLMSNMNALKIFVENRMVFASVMAGLERREDVEMMDAVELGRVDDDDELGEEARAMIAMLEEGDDFDISLPTPNNDVTDHKEDDASQPSPAPSAFQPPLSIPVRDLVDVLYHFALLPVADTWARDVGVVLVEGEDEDVIPDPGVARGRLRELIEVVAAREMSRVRGVAVEGDVDTTSTSGVMRSMGEAEGTGPSGGLFLEGNADAGTDAERDNDFVRKTIESVACEAVGLLASLVRFAPVRRYLIQEQHFVPVLIRLFRTYRTMSENVMMALGVMIPLADPPRTNIDIPTLFLTTRTIWKALLQPLLQKPGSRFYAEQILGYAAKWSSADVEGKAEVKSGDEEEEEGQVMKEQAAERNHEGYIEWSATDRTDLVIVGFDRLELRNDSWTFESIRATHGIPLSAPTPRKYAYEVLLRTEGLIQVGWTARDSLFDPEGGTGVGDDDLSYGYDGFRAKKWHGRWSDECAYGLVWTVGDVVTTTIDLDERTIHYYLNGKDMGIAFENVDGQLVWFPALSIATGQGCRACFGGVLDPMQYLPEEYKPIASVLDLSLSLEIEDNSTGEMVNENAVAEGEDLAIKVERSLVRRASGKRSNRRHLLEPSSVPSFYFEVTASICKISLGDGRSWVKGKPRGPAQIGAFDDQGRVVSLVHDTRLISSPSTLLICQVPLETLQDGRLPQVLTDCFEKGEHAEARELVLENLPHVFTLKDGDVVGVLFERELGVVGIVVNKVVFAQISLRDYSAFASFSPIVPHIANLNKYILNVGQEPFEYHPGNTMVAVDKNLGYLDG